jgi:rhodanese-related sulfurtransferase
MKITLLLTLILSISAFSACQPQEPEKAPNAQESGARNEIKQISVTQAKEATVSNDVQFIDVRTEEEYASRHAPKTKNFPLDRLEKELSKLEKDKPVYVICHTGRRSQKGSEILQKAGFKEIYNIQGGTGAWIDAGLPTE